MALPKGLTNNKLKLKSYLSIW